MPIYTSSKRDYRGLCGPARNEQGFQVVVEQTDLWVVAEQDLSRAVRGRVNELRGMVKAAITLDPAFGTSLAPVAVKPDAPLIIREMALAARLANVGPMAAVAGAVAQHTADHLVSQSPNLLVENGGDLFLHSTRDRVVALLPDPSSDAGLGLRLEARDFPLALCSSSATIGHSLSLGQGELVTVRAQNAALADAAATALCNLLKHKNDLNLVVEAAKRLADDQEGLGGIQGVFAQCGGRLAVWGRMELTALNT